MGRLSTYLNFARSTEEAFTFVQLFQQGVKKPITLDPAA